jgi:hypothetical protein
MRTFLPIALLAASLQIGCVANSICAKERECDDELEEDTFGVCVELYNAGIAALRANEEEDCQKLADAQLAFDACRSQLDCDDFEELDLGGECEDELDDLRDAQDDAKDQCLSSN